MSTKGLFVTNASFSKEFYNLYITSTIVEFAQKKGDFISRVELDLKSKNVTINGESMPKESIDTLLKKIDIVIKDLNNKKAEAYITSPKK